ncbi:hypothetical protein [Peribacillus tepidiphilus]|uniref:hypothetical protein n=1 Tax=Peribacillus tepidiphilus TaxID=2652445 RepID=UPI0035B510DE
MKKLTKGALAMVLAGSFTFSVTNALLVNQSSKKFTEENASTISGDPKKTGIISKAEKTVKDHTPTTNVKDGQTKLSHDIPAFQESLKNRNKSDMAIAAIQQNRKKFSKRTTTNPANTDTATTTKPAATAISSTRAKAPTTTTTPVTTGTNTTNVTTTPVATTIPSTSTKAPTATTTPTATGTNTTTSTTKTTSTTTKTTNRGQQVSQAAKEKAASHEDKKDKNGKKI